MLSENSGARGRSAGNRQNQRLRVVQPTLNSDAILRRPARALSNLLAAISAGAVR